MSECIYFVGTVAKQELLLSCIVKEHILNLKNSRQPRHLRIEAEKKWLFIFTTSVFFFARTVGASKKFFFN
jgi:hypothetical protein